ncbi:MAG: BON domain-containing protein [Anaerolineae bacterium]|nr:BON domain-containing protein [Anaerolineae bacterium]
MTEPAVVVQRPDIDIHNEIVSIITQYPPTAADRFHIHVSVQEGVVVLSGHVLTPINRRYLINQIPKVVGVQSVDGTQLFDDETIRLEVGRRLPKGLVANVRRGTVTLSGALPGEEPMQGIAALVASVPGVVRIVATG